MKKLFIFILFVILLPLRNFGQSTWCLPPVYNPCTDSTTVSDTDLVHQVYVGASMQGVQNWGMNLLSSLPHWIGYYSNLVVGAKGWKLLGNAGTSAGTNFIGTTDTKDLVFKTNATENMRIAQSSKALCIGTTTSPFGDYLVVDGNHSAGIVGLNTSNSNGAYMEIYPDASDNGSFDLLNSAGAYITRLGGPSRNSFLSMWVPNGGNFGIIQYSAVNPAFFTGQWHVSNLGCGAFGLWNQYNTEVMRFGKETGSYDYLVDSAGFGIGTKVPDSTCSILDMESTTKGFIEPQLTTTQKNAVVSPIEGLNLYDKTLHAPQFWNGSAWQSIGTGTVTSVGSGNGLTGGPITSSGTIKIDTIGATKTSTNYNVLHQLAIFSGTSNITTLGTIGTGTWQGSVIQPGYVKDSVIKNGANNILQWVRGSTYQQGDVIQKYIKADSLTTANTGVLQGNGSTVSLSTALANGTTVTSQSNGDNSTKPSSDAFTLANPTDYTLQAYQALGSTIKAQTIGLVGADITTTVTLSSGGYYAEMIYIPYTQTITGVKWYQTVQGSYTANNYNGIAIYSLSSGTASILDSTTNNGGIFKQTANTWVTSPFVSTVSLSRGVYMVVLNYNSSANTTNPGFGCTTSLVNAGVSTIDFTNSSFLFGFKTGQVTCPATIGLSTIGASNAVVVMGLY